MPYLTSFTLTVTRLLPLLWIVIFKTLNHHALSETSCFFFSVNLQLSEVILFLVCYGWLLNFLIIKQGFIK